MRFIYISHKLPKLSKPNLGNNQSPIERVVSKLLIIIIFGARSFRYAFMRGTRGEGRVLYIM